MKICAISDLHGYLPAIPPCELLLIAGDLCPATSHELAFQSDWLDRCFRLWLNRQPAKQAFVIWGNHDLIGEQPEHLPSHDLWGTLLMDQAVTYRGLKIYGTPWQPKFMEWAFNLDESELAEKWALIPNDTDILITHGPPRGYGDLVSAFNDRPAERAGSPSLLARIIEVKPKLCVFGHVHEGRGQWEMGGTKLANVTLVNEDYRPIYQPMLIGL